MVHWLRLHAFTAGSVGSNPSQETKTSLAKKKKAVKNHLCLLHLTQKCYLPHSVPLEINNWSQEQKDDTGTKNMRSGAGLQEATYQNWQVRRANKSVWSYAHIKIFHAGSKISDGLKKKVMDSNSLFWILRISRQGLLSLTVRGKPKIMTINTLWFLFQVIRLKKTLE